MSALALAGLAAAASLETRALVPVSPVLLVAIVLVAAALCFALGTLRGSWRAWLVGYALTLVALVLAYGGVLHERRAAAPAPEAATAGGRSPVGPTSRSAEGHR